MSRNDKERTWGYLLEVRVFLNRLNGRAYRGREKWIVVGPYQIPPTSRGGGELSKNSHYESPSFHIHSSPPPLSTPTQGGNTKGEGPIRSGGKEKRREDKSHPPNKSKKFRARQQDVRVLLGHLKKGAKIRKSLHTVPKRRKKDEVRSSQRYTPWE